MEGHQIRGRTADELLNLDHVGSALGSGRPRREQGAARSTIQTQRAIAGFRVAFPAEQESGRPRGENGRPDHPFRRGLRRSCSHVSRLSRSRPRGAQGRPDHYSDADLCQPGSARGLFSQLNCCWDRAAHRRCCVRSAYGCHPATPAVRMRDAAIADKLSELVTG
jgi:hypothetical protein